MKLTFLGTSHGIPASDRYCSCTMLEIGDAVYLIDAGAPVADSLLRAGKTLEQVRAIFTTHIHSDHIAGLFLFTDLCNWKFLKARPAIYMTEQVGIDLLQKSVEAMDLHKSFDADRISLRLMTKNTVYEDENIRVTPILTAHLKCFDHPAFGYLVEAEGKRIVFTGDMSQNLEYRDFPKIALETPVDLTVSEMAHFGIPELSWALEAYRGKRLVFNHVFPVEKLKEIAELNGTYGYPVHAVSDGETMEL